MLNFQFQGVYIYIYSNNIKIICNPEIPYKEVASKSSNGLQDSSIVSSLIIASNQDIQEF